jgi:hypothetical protein
MTRATRCDKCWNFECGDPVLKVSTMTVATSETPAVTKSYDLCTPCVDQLVNVFLKPPTLDAPMDSYTERGV